MEIIEHKNKQFMAKYERHEPLIKDHTSMIAFKACKRKFFYQIVLGKIPKADAIYFAWGQAYHKFREVLEASDGNKEKAILAGLKIWMEKQGADPPVGHKFAFLTRDRLLKSFLKAYEWRENEKKSGKIEVIAVEQSFNIQLPDGTWTGGRADQIVRWNGKLWGRDFKTSSKEGKFYSRTLDPNDQFTRYTYSESKLSGERVQGQIIEVLYNAAKSGPEISTYIAARSQQQLDQWEKDQIQVNKMLDLCRENDVWPMEEVGCPFCPYHSICKMPTEAAMMAKLDQEYITRPWDHTNI